MIKRLVVLLMLVSASLVTGHLNAQEDGGSGSVLPGEKVAELERQVLNLERQVLQLNTQLVVKNEQVVALERENARLRQALAGSTGELPDFLPDGAVPFQYEGRHFFVIPVDR